MSKSVTKLPLNQFSLKHPNSRRPSARGGTADCETSSTERSTVRGFNPKFSLFSSNNNGVADSRRSKVDTEADADADESAEGEMTTALKTLGRRLGQRFVTMDAWVLSTMNAKDVTEVTSTEVGDDGGVDDSGAKRNERQIDDSDYDRQYLCEHDYEYDDGGATSRNVSFPLDHSVLSALYNESSNILNLQEKLETIKVSLLGDNVTTKNDLVGFKKHIRCLFESVTNNNNNSSDSSDNNNDRNTSIENLDRWTTNGSNVQPRQSVDPSQRRIGAV